LSLLLVLFSALRGFSPGTLVFPSPHEQSSKFQFDLDYCQALYHQPLARVIAQALPVFDVKFTFTFYLYYSPLQQKMAMNANECFKVPMK